MASLWAGWVGWAGLGFLAGSAPWWCYALANGPAALLAELAGAAISGVDRSPYLLQVARHGFNLVVLGLPAALGLRPPWEVRWLALPLLPFALAFWLGVLGYSVRQLLPARRKRALVSRNGLGSLAGSLAPQPVPNAKSFSLPVSQPEATHMSTMQMEKATRWLLAGVALTLGAGFLFTPFGVDPSGRYFLPLAVVLALFGAQTILRLRQAWGKPAYALAGLVLAFNAWGTLECVLHNPPGLTTQFDSQTQVDHRDDPALIAFLSTHGEWYGYTNYWVAYPLAFHSQESLIFVPDLPYHQDLRHTTRDNRYPPYARQVAQAERAAYITTGQPLLEGRLREGFERLGVGWKEEQVGDYRVFYGLTRHVRPEEIDLSPLQ